MASRTRRSKETVVAAETAAETAMVADAAPAVNPEPTVHGASTETQTRLRPGQCRAYMRRALAQEFDGIVKGFIQGAKSGSCPHVKLATEFLEPRPRAKRAKSGRRTIERWIDEMERGV